MTVGIVGLGLIGGSFAKSIRADRPSDRILVSERSEETLDRAHLLGLYDGLVDRDSIREVDLLLLALYPRAAIAWLKEHAGEISRHTVVVDLAGIKSEICRVGAELSRAHGFRFVGGHPMAGREISGIEASRDDLFIGASMILTPDGDASVDVLSSLKAFFLSLGFSRVVFSSPAEHDRIISYTSQLAHVISNAYISSPMAEVQRGFSAGSFRDMTRVAEINAEMWSEILVSNREHLLPELDRLIGSLSEIRQVVAMGDESGLCALLAKGAQRKREYGG
ncbi:MAG: prephenate dehydrogenase/arogenate dehydrogenase family protein [Clostridia bacterium]|nr:prephenate dehydrogenase/arogenate dehydrogenase family protein [Clostridia bacterium]